MSGWCRALYAMALVLAIEPGPAVLGIDHVPVAVADLQGAGERYRSLGFRLKPGRPHANGIENLHAKFPDGTEVELITAPAATDSLTRTYRTHLKDGDGPAFVALFARPGTDVPRQLKDDGVVVPSYVFFGPRQASPTDRPEHFAHPNTAYALTRVWLAGEDLSAERRLLTAVGATFRREAVDVPDRAQADVAAFAQGSVVLLPARHQMVRGRPIVGITIAVRDLDAAQRLAGPEARRAGASVFVEPSRALGYWLEFRR
jgi:catechol 2,3-dioxygenase-like lactoylglutathione lyase family enzyme